MRKKYKYSIEVDISDYCISDTDGYGLWCGADTIISEGDCLRELIESSEVYWSDQDGGEVPEKNIDLDILESVIAREFLNLIK